MQELLYHVTEQDGVIGPVPRGLAHQQGLLHRGGVAFLFNASGQVYLQHRADKETFPRCFEGSAAWHVAFGESYEGAAARECAEETGVTTPLTYAGKFRISDPPEEEWISVHVGRWDGGIRLDPSEATGGGWYADAMVREIIRSGNVTPWLRGGYPLAVRSREQ